MTEIVKKVSIRNAKKFIEEFNSNIKEMHLVLRHTNGTFEVNFPFFDVQVIIFPPENENSLTQTVKIIKGSKTNFDNDAFANIFVEHINKHYS